MSDRYSRERSSEAASALWGSQMPAFLQEIEQGLARVWLLILASQSERVLHVQRAEASLRTAQAELAHVGRVATLGQLTASISHEITQPIASARNNARAALNFLNKEAPNLAEIREALACIVADTDRAGQIIDRIREQTRKAPSQRDRFD